MQGGSLKPNNLAFISVVMNTLVPGHNSDVPGRDKGTAARIHINRHVYLSRSVAFVTSRGCTGRDGGSWACSLCSPCGSAACGTPGDPWPRQPSRSASRQLGLSGYLQCFRCCRPSTGLTARWCCSTCGGSSPSRCSCPSPPTSSPPASGPPSSWPQPASSWDPLSGAGQRESSLHVLV